jgi:putative membrane protein
MTNTFRSSILATLFLGSVTVVVPRFAEAGSESDSHALGAKDPNIKKDLSDAQLLGVADTVNTGEIDRANVAIEKSQSDPVKQFAQTMLKDHTEAKEQGRKLLAEYGIAVSGLSAGMQKESDETMTQLETVVPSSFDRTYLQSQIRMHEKLIKALDDVIPQAQGPQLKGLLQYMRQQADRHLATARSTLQSLGG